LDETFPATLSRRITHDLLRAELGFNGVIVSDDVGMRAVSALFDSGETAAQFMAAGNDMLMICAHWADTERARTLAEGILAGRRSGTLDARLLDRARERVDALLQTTAQNSVQPLSEDTFRAHAAAGPLFSDVTVEVV
jgi:beta-N-acetylhexosaminidase